MAEKGVFVLTYRHTKPHQANYLFWILVVFMCKEKKSFVFARIEDLKVKLTSKYDII